MKSFWRYGYAIIGVIAISIVAQGCSGGGEEADVKPNPALDGMKPVPDDLSKMDTGPGKKGP